MNFNSHAHVERDGITKMLTIRTKISTHTLTWSVTTCPCCGAKAEYNFNSHAHVERDAGSRPSIVKQDNFNSHAHVERDVFLFFNIQTKTDFNSHAHVERDERA